MAKREGQDCIPPWLEKILNQKEVADFFESPDHRELITHVAWLVGEYRELACQYQAGHHYTVRDAEKLILEWERCLAEFESSRSPESVRNAWDLQLKYWEDQFSVASLLAHLSVARGMKLLNGFLKGCREVDIFAMALQGRAILELGVMTADYLRNPLAIFDRMARERKFIHLDDLDKKLEEPIVQAIWGTRLGSSNLGDGKKGRVATPLWSSGELHRDFEIAKNILTSFQGRARRIESGLGKTEFKVYEILSDVVHPAALGYQLLLAAEPSEHGSGRDFSVVDCDKNEALRAYIAQAAVFANCQGLSLIVDVARGLSRALDDCRQWIIELRQTRH
jgi:hypothetical protein